MSSSPVRADVRPLEPMMNQTNDRAGHAKSSWRTRMREALPTLFVFLVLGGLLAWGHSTDWTLPKFSALMGRDADDDDDDAWCEEHSVPKAICVECKPDLMPRAKAHGWCKVHGVHECPLCHSTGEVAAGDVARVKQTLAMTPRTENNEKCKLHERRIQFASHEAALKAGVDVDIAWPKAMIEFVSATGEIQYDPTRTARLSARVPGVIFQIRKQVGDVVKKGDILAIIDAAEVGKAKSELMQALIQYRLKAQHLQSMVASAGANPERAIREMEANVSEARIRLTSARESMTNLGLPVDVESLLNTPQEKLADALRFVGLPKEITDTLDARTTTGNLLAVAAPFDGTVVERQVVDREVVDGAKVLFTVIDVRQLWLMLDVRADEASLAALGQEVRFQPDGGKECRGSVAWLSTEADHKTRTVKVRAHLDNKDGRLRANTFGTGKVILREASDALVVPSSAVHWDGCCNVVFVRDADYSKEGSLKVFHVRTVRPGARDDRDIEIIVGLRKGDVVATAGSGVLRAELLKAKLGEGEGCCGTGKK